MTYDLTGNHAYNIDCMELMRQVPDKYFDLSVCDPPYGGGASSQSLNVERERERERLQGGIGSYKGAITGRFFGRFEKYHLGIEDRRDLGGEVQPAKGCL